MNDAIAVDVPKLAPALAPVAVPKPVVPPVPAMPAVASKFNEKPEPPKVAPKPTEVTKPADPEVTGLSLISRLVGKLNKKNAVIGASALLSLVAGIAGVKFLAPGDDAPDTAKAPLKALGSGTPEPLPTPPTGPGAAPIFALPGGTEGSPIAPGPKAPTVAPLERTQEPVYPVAVGPKPPESPAADKPRGDAIAPPIPLPDSITGRGTGDKNPVAGGYNPPEISLPLIPTTPGRSETGVGGSKPVDALGSPPPKAPIAPSLAPSSDGFTAVGGVKPDAPPPPPDDLTGGFALPKPPPAVVPVAGQSDPKKDPPVVPAAPTIPGAPSVLPVPPTGGAGPLLPALPALPGDKPMAPALPALPGDKPKVPVVETGPKVPDPKGPAIPDPKGPASPDPKGPIQGRPVDSGTEPKFPALPIPGGMGSGTGVGTGSGSPSISIAPPPAGMGGAAVPKVDPDLGLGGSALPKLPVGPASPAKSPSDSVPMPPAKLEFTKPAVPAVSPERTPTDRTPTTSYDEDIYEPTAKDSWPSISREFYNDTRYADALRAYNRNKPLQGSGPVLVPPIHIVKKYTQGVVAPAGGTGSPVPATSGGLPEWNGAEKVFRVPSGGMTIGGIARITLGSEQKWDAIARLNPALKPDDRLAPGTEVKLPPEARLPN